MKETTKIFQQFLEVHGPYWYNISEEFPNVDGLLLAVCSAWDGVPITLWDKEKNMVYYTYIRCYISPALQLNPIKKYTLQSLLQSRTYAETKMDVLFKNPLTK